MTHVLLGDGPDLEAAVTAAWEVIETVPPHGPLVRALSRAVVDAAFASYQKVEAVTLRFCQAHAHLAPLSGTISERGQRRCLWKERCDDLGLFTTPEECRMVDAFLVIPDVKEKE
jgi:hypothetical protein